MWWWWILAASAAPRGDYVHVATVPVLAVHSPEPIAPTLRIGAWAPASDSGFWLAHGRGELIRVTPGGGFDRRAAQRVRTSTMWIMTRFQVDGSSVVYFDGPQGTKRADLRTGAIESFVAGDGERIGAVMRVGEQWVRSVADGSQVRFLKDGAWSDPQPAIRNKDASLVDGGRAIPCGGLPDGTSLIAWESGPDTVHIGTLTEDLTVGRELWSARLPEDSVVRRSEVTSCSMVGDRVLLGRRYPSGATVFEGRRWVADIPQGEGPDVVNLVHAQLVNEDGVVVVAEFQSAIKVYAPNVAVNALGNRPMDRLRAGVQGADRLQAMWELGWWGAVWTEAKAQRDRAWQARARARLIAYWARSGPMMQTWMGPNKMQVLDEQFLPEIEGLLKGHPKEGWLHYAKALLLRRLGRSTEADAALAALEDVLPASHGPSAVDVSELFELAAARGDVARMKRMHRALDPADTRTRALWGARIARVEGDPDQGLALLRPLGRDDADLVALQARLEGDRGALDEAIASWTRARTLGLDEDPQTLGGLGVAYLRRGLVELAVEALLEAVDRDPETVAYRSNLAAALAEQDRQADAMKQLYGALGRAPEDPVLQFQLKSASGASSTKPGGALAVLPFDVAGGAVDRVGMGMMLSAMSITELAASGRDVVERGAPRGALC